MCVHSTYILLFAILMAKIFCNMAIREKERANCECTLYRKYKFIMLRLHNHAFFEQRDGTRRESGKSNKRAEQKRKILRARLYCEFTVQPSQFPFISVQFSHTRPFDRLPAAFTFSYFSLVRFAPFSVSNCYCKTKARSCLSSNHCVRMQQINCIRNHSFHLPFVRKHVRVA